MASFSSYAVIGFVLVLVICVFALRRAPRRWWVVAGAVIAALGLAVQAWVLVPLFVGGSDTKSDLTVMTSNLQFGRGDTTAVVRTVASEDVDVLVLEEVTPEALERLVKAGLAELLPHRGGEAVAGADGTMAFSRYPLTTSRPLRLGKGGVDVQVAAPEPFRLLAVHANYPLEGAGRWLADLETIRDRTAAAVDQGPTLVVGDFNATHDHEPLRAVLDAGVRDAAEQAGSGWQATWPTKRYGQDWVWPVLTIDHVLTSPRFDAVRTESLAIPRTDHLALLAELRYRE
jgi:endonuclease/exonuclease/phosphatase (EEP) superfamily protein YafD